MLPKVIAICGAKRAGKDTIAAFISNNYGYKHVKISQTLKEVCKTLFGFTNEEIENDEKDIVNKKWGVSPRTVMQFIGTELFQYKIQEILPDVGKKFWINSLIESLKQSENYVISDLRFLHEYEELKKTHDVIFIRVDTTIPLVSLRKKDEHVSENEFVHIPVNYVIQNDLINKSEVYKQIEKILFKIN